MIQIRSYRKRNYVGGVVVALLVVAAIFIPQLRPTHVNAAGETIVGTSTVSGRVNQQIPITGISINGTGNDTIPVKVHVDSGSVYMATTTGLTFTGATSGSQIVFTGLRNDVNTALATLHYSGTSVGSDTLTISLADGNTIYNPTNGHVYQYIPGDIDWFDARDAAATLSYEGTPGYLATITSQDENDFIKDRLNGDAWLGASDDAQYLGEGHWSWVDGPEVGTNFYNGEGSDGQGGGAPVGSSYTNWAGPDSEPNNSGGSENCMETYISNGTWNDLPCDDGDVSGYVVEYGNDVTNPSGIPTKDVAITTTAATFAGGSGTPQDPYQITDCERLQDLNQDLSANYVLSHNIDCTDTPNWNGGQGFVPIGTNHDSTGPFVGTIDGAGYSIDGLTEIRADDDPTTTDNSNNGDDYATNQDYVGLIGYGNGVTITDLHLTHAKIKGYMFVGGLVGFMSNGDIESSSVNEGLNESSDTSCAPGYCVWARYGVYGGGLVGYMTGGTINGGKVGGLVKGSGNIIGGLVGYTEYAAIADSGSTAAIDGGGYIGGAVGQLYGASSLTRVFATGNVIAKVDDEVGKVGVYAGGLIGAAGYTTIDQSYATGNVHADGTYAGGLAGSMSGATVNDVYATGDVSAGGSFAGGLIGGDDDNTIARAYASGNVDAPYASGGFTGSTYNDTISDSFAAGTATSADSSNGAFNGDSGSSITFSEDYFDIISTQHTSCIPGQTTTGCIGINSSNSQTQYLFDYVNAPFSQSGSRVWTNTIWYFDGTHYPVLRMGTNNSISARPIYDDNDGVSAVVENAAPNNGDGNNDGTLDSTQANVVSFVNPVTSKYVTIQVDSSCSFTAATSATNPAGGDTSYSYPFGLVNYTVDCGTPGFSTNVTIYYHDLSSPNGMIVRKYNATTGTYATVSNATISGTNPVEVSYTLTDGGSLDEDGSANGIIVDPIGLATPTPTNPATTQVSVPNTGLKSQNMFVIVSSGIAGVVLIGLGIVIIRRSPAKNAKN